MEPIPEIEADPSILTLCEEVAEGRVSVQDGVVAMQSKLEPLLESCTHMGHINVYAVLIVEQLNPRSQGLLMDEDQLSTMWNEPQEQLDDQPDLHIAFLVCACIQITSLGPVREGAKALGQEMDRLLPEDW